MADYEWLTTKEMNALSFEQRVEYINRRISTILEQNSEDEDEMNASMDVEESDAEEMQLPEYEPEDETDTDDDVEEVDNASNYIDRDGSVWSNEPTPKQHTLKQHHIENSYCGPHKRTESLCILETFQLLFSKEMCDIIIKETNKKARQCQGLEHLWKPLTSPEFDAYLGILLMCGATQSEYMHMRDLWKTNSYPLYRAAMDLERFWDITRFIRFDNSQTREKRKKIDKSAAIADIFLILNGNLHQNYKARTNVTVGEQLYAFRGGSGFMQYIPSKPAKYGMKVWWLCDSVTSYPLKGQIYTGLAEKEKNLGERVVKDLCCNLFYGSGRNIVCGKLFTTYNLARTLLLDYNLSMLGAVNKSQTFVPPQFGKPRGRPVGSTIFGFRNNVTLSSYVPKKNKSLVLLSTSHYDAPVEGLKNKPMMIKDYECHKGGVENMEKWLSEYTTKRRTNRWTLAFFYNILDVSAFAAFVIYMENNSHLQKSTNRRRIFLQQLSEQLSMPNILARAENTQIPRNFSSRNGIESILGQPLKTTVDQNTSRTEPERDATGRIKQKGNCYLCSKRRSTRKACRSCNKPVCVEHSFDETKCQICL